MGRHRASWALPTKFFAWSPIFTVWYISFSGMICRQLFSPDHFQKLFPTYLFQDKKKSHQKFVFITVCHLLWYLQGPPPGWQLKLQRESQEHTINQFSINMCEWKDMETTLHNHNKYFLQSYVYVNHKSRLQQTEVHLWLSDAVPLLVPLMHPLQNHNVVFDSREKFTLG